MAAMLALEKPIRHFAIELHFHDNLKAKLINTWNMLENYSSSPFFMDTEPNVTICIFRLSVRHATSLQLDKLLSFDSSCRFSFPVSLSTIVIGNKVETGNKFLAFSAFPDWLLRILHTHIFNKVVSMAPPISQEWHPEAWNPLCLLAEQVRPEKMKDAINTVMQQGLPFTGFAKRIALVNLTGFRYVMSELSLPG